MQKPIAWHASFVPGSQCIRAEAFWVALIDLGFNLPPWGMLPVKSQDMADVLELVDDVFDADYVSVSQHPVGIGTPRDFFGNVRITLKHAILVKTQGSHRDSSIPMPD